MGSDPVDPADLPDTPWRMPALVQPGVSAAPLALPVRAAAGGGLSLDVNLDAALHDDHTEDTPPTAIPGHFGYTAEALVARLLEEDDPEETSLRAPLTPVRGKIAAKAAAASVPAADVASQADAAPEAPVASAPSVASAPTAPAPSPAVPSANAGNVAVPLWAVAATFFVLGLMAGCLLTLFVMAR